MHNSIAIAALDIFLFNISVFYLKSILLVIASVLLK